MNPVKNDDYITLRDNVLTYDFAGINANFKKGQKLNNYTNPPLINYPIFSIDSSIFMLGKYIHYRSFAPLILNGLEVKVLDDANGIVTVQVSKDKVNVESNFRMAAKDVYLPNITN